LRFGAIELSEQPFDPPKDRLLAAVIDGVRISGLESLPWSNDAQSIRTRNEWLRTHHLVGSDWPDLSNDNLITTLEKWLGPYCNGITRRSHFHKLDMTKIIRSLFTYQQFNELDRLAPTHMTVPTGSRILLDYSSGSQPVLAVRLQEMFGETHTPTVAGGNVKVLIHLLSPARRPLAVTQDLPSFWENAYIEVRKDMRGQYPKHVWPENPLKEKPTKRTKQKK
jgi:ATP-dependent helicase HrpB